MADGRLGLIDYGQCKRITPAERFAIAKFVVAVADRRPPHEVAEALRGFATTCHCNRHCNHRDHLQPTTFAVRGCHCAPRSLLCCAHWCTLLAEQRMAVTLSPGAAW
jgi:hypothetical protein